MRLLTDLIWLLDQWIQSRIDKVAGDDSMLQAVCVSRAIDRSASTLDWQSKENWDNFIGIEVVS